MLFTYCADVPHDLRYQTFPYRVEQEAPPALCSAHVALLRAHIRTKLAARYGTRRGQRYLAYALNALALRGDHTTASLVTSGLPARLEYRHLLAEVCTWRDEIAVLGVVQRCQERYLQRRHGLPALAAWSAVHAVIQTAYAASIHWRRRPWLQLAARCWN